MPENADIATVVYDAEATDAGGTADAGITYTLGGTDEDAFSIDADDGEVRLNAPADHETQASYALIAIATDATGNNSATQAVTVTVTDVNDAPTITGTPDTSVAQDAEYNFTPVGADADANDTLTYSIQNKPDWASFDTTTGALTGTPDNDDVGSTSDIVISVSDGSLTTALAAFDLAVTNENIPVFSSGHTATVIENAPVTTVVYDAQASIADGGADEGITYTLGGADAAAFSIDADDGEVRLNAPADRETKASYALIVTATGNNSATQMLAVNVTDVDEAPVFSSPATASVAENADIATVVYDAQASDDGGADDAGITYTLGGADATLFSIDIDSGEVRLLASADFETKASYALIVTATDFAFSDAAGKAATQSVTVSVTDVDEIDPVFSGGASATASVAENAPALTTVVYNAQASDNGGTDDAGIRYFLGGADAAFFSIDADDGEVRLNAPADFETQARYALDVIATDATGNAATQAVTVTVTDVVDEPPVLAFSGVADRLVNTYTTGSQTASSVTDLSDGGWVVIWQSAGQDGSGAGIYGQAYAANGTSQGSEFRVNTFTSGDQRYPSVTGLEGGGWVATWTSNGQDGSSASIYGQVYTADGTRQGNEFRVNTYTTGSQAASSVTGLSDGGWVATWTSNGQDGSGYGIYGQAYTADGTRQGAEFRVNTYTSGRQGSPSVTGLSDGGWVVTWQNGSSTGVRGQAYTADGTRQGNEFRVNTETNGHQRYPSVTGLSDGGWVVTWGSIGQDGRVPRVYGHAYAADGVAQGAEFRVNTTFSGYQATVTGLEGGGWVVAWQGGSAGIYSKSYNADGSERAEPVTYTEGDAAVRLFAGLSVADNDSATLVSALIALTDPVSGDTLGLAAGYSLPTGISQSYNSASGVLAERQRQPGGLRGRP